jgi:hypothetical protein
MSGSFDNLPRLQSLDEGEYGKISAGLRPPHSIFTTTDSCTEAKGYPITVGMGWQPCFAEILGNALGST